jgi:Mlc titration factor MtfA (ptsG expression regulator)
MGFLSDWRRRRVLAGQSIDEALWLRVASALPFLRGLSEDEAARLRQLALLFLSEKEMHGAQDLALTDEVRLSIAVQACLPILNLGLDVYKGWIGVIVYPREFRVRKEEMDENGVVHTIDQDISGEAWPGGPVILSWEDVGLPTRGYNVVIHEFAHKIHMENPGDQDFPAERAGMDPEDWREILENSYTRFCAEVDSGRPTFIDPYAAEHPAEFFAVMSEAFFTESAVLARDWPDLYGQLALFYRQNPAERLSPRPRPRRARHAGPTR